MARRTSTRHLRTSALRLPLLDTPQRVVTRASSSSITRLLRLGLVLEERWAGSRWELEQLEVHPWEVAWAGRLEARWEERWAVEWEAEWEE